MHPLTLLSPIAIGAVHCKKTCSALNSGEVAMILEDNLNRLDTLRDHLRRGTIEVSEAREQYLAFCDGLQDTGRLTSVSVDALEDDNRALKVWLVRAMAEVLSALAEQLPPERQDLRYRGYRIQPRLFDRDGGWVVVYGIEGEIWPSLNASTRRGAIAEAANSIDRILDVERRQ